VFCNNQRGDFQQDIFCTNTLSTAKPVTSRACNEQVCEYRWIVNDFEGEFGWSTCSALCGTGVQTRAAICNNQFDTFVFATLCIAGDKPAISRACNAPAACAVDCIGAYEYDKCGATCGAGTQTGTFAIVAAAKDGGKTCDSEFGATTTRECSDLPPCPFDLELRIRGDFDAITRDTFISDFEADMSNALSTTVSVLDVRRGSIRVGFSVTPTTELTDLAAVVAELDAQMTTQGSKLLQGTVTSDIDTSFTAIAFVANVEGEALSTGGASASSPIAATIGGTVGAILIAALLVWYGCRRKKK
jgi:hypothetical protein